MKGKTKQLRAVIKAQLNRTPGETYYRRAPKDAATPYKVFDLQNANLGDISRDDLSLIIDVWDIAPDPKRIEDIADEIEDILGAENVPAPPVYPTFFRDGRFPVDDDNKDIQRIQLTFTVQNYAFINEGGESNE